MPLETMEDALVCDEAPTFGFDGAALPEESKLVDAATLAEDVAAAAAAAAAADASSIDSH